MEYRTTIKRGKVFERTIKLTTDGALYSFAGCTVRGQMRHPAEPDAVNFTITLEDDPITDAALAVVRIRIGALTTKNLHLGRWSFDIEAAPASGEDDTFEIVRGIINVIGETTV